VVAWWSSGRTRTPKKSSRLFFSPLAHPQVPLVESGKHQLIMMASMKVIRAVDPSGGPTTEWAAAGLEDEASSIQPAAS